MLFGALGDIHGDFSSARRIMERRENVPFWVCVGDLADEQGRYESLPRPLYWIKGNNENFDLIAAGGLPGNLHYLPNAAAIDIGNPRVRIAGLGGTLAPTWYETRAADLPHPKKGSAKATGLADKRRHFVREEVDACAAMRGVDLFMTHEAPRPYRLGRLDAGKTPVNEVLAAMRRGCTCSAIITGSPNRSTTACARWGSTSCRARTCSSSRARWSTISGRPRSP